MDDVSDEDEEGNDRSNDRIAVDIAHKNEDSDQFGEGEEGEEEDEDETPEDTPRQPNPEEMAAAAQ